MKLYSTKNPSQYVSLKEAIFKGLPDDNGLFMPWMLPKLSDDFIQQLPFYTFPQLSFEVAKTLIQDTIPDNDLRNIIDTAINFPAPIEQLDANTFILELFHGPSLAFKDFGARFMAETMSYFLKNDNKKLTILVATSGDTGGAVASGFYKTEGIEVIILYPSGKVSLLQEKQLTTLGHNITALEVQGSFDDCQALVKQAFLDSELHKAYNLSSANSINIARLIPQTFYYFEGYKQVVSQTKLPVVFSVPSGNFGNLTAGLFAQQMGLPVCQFIAATNANDVVPQYLNTGKYAPRPSIATLSNAMDVGNPSNFVRILDLYCSTWNIVGDKIKGYAFSDAQTRAAIKAVYEQFNYVMDPHGAVGYLALQAYQKSNPDTAGVVFETAHPSKFIDVVENTLNRKIDIPPTLAALTDKQKDAVLISTTYSDFKKWLLERR
ncbi:MAG: threonine synthase [Saprospiraceae bacterium]|nr:threonine synthase [Saprospiraceae bacterium]MBP7679648.1 threonine synthase [Saprospiraceae bacterium]